MTMEWITRQILRDNPDKAFLFGDNVDQRGMKGQAKEMRGEPNAFGIPTKLHPSMGKYAFFDDKDFNYNCWCIDKAIKKVKESGFDTVVIPEAGLGTGLAELDERAPSTFDYLKQQLEALST